MIYGANICRATSHRPTTATLLIGPHFYAGRAANNRALTGRKAGRFFDLISALLVHGAFFAPKPFINTSQSS